MNNDEIREIGIEYLTKCGFVENYTKKLMFPSDIDSLLNDYIQEVWLAILELKPEKWRVLYDSAINKQKDYEYEIRNFISIVIRNTVRSTNSNAYRKLKRESEVMYRQDKKTWEILENTIEDVDYEITKEIEYLNE